MSRSETPEPVGPVPTGIRTPVTEQRDDALFAVPPPAEGLPFGYGLRALPDQFVNGALRSFTSLYCSATHPDCWIHEDLFALQGTFKEQPHWPPVGIDEREGAECLMTLRDPKQRHRIALELVVRLGLDGTPPIAGPMAALHRLARIGLIDRQCDERLEQALRHDVSAILAEARRVVRAGTSNAEQRVARRFLADVEKIVSGTRRGRPRRADAYEVRDFYYRRLFRLERALRLLEAWPWPGRAAEKIRLVGEAADLTADESCELRWANELRRPLAVKAQARSWTAIAFDIDERRVANILAPTGVPPSGGSSRTRRFRDRKKSRRG